MAPVSIPPGPKGYVASGGERIYFESWGRGDAVVFAHGLGGNHAIWFQQVPAFAARHQVITWDQRGFGRSTRTTGELGPEPAVGDLAAVLDRLDVERAHVVGQSMGGWVALGFAVTHAERVASLVLADTVGGIFTPEIREAFLAYGEVIATSPPPDQLPLGEHPALGPQLAAEDPALAFLYGQIGGLTPGPPPAEISRLLAQTDLTDRLDGLRAPTLFLVGENDPIFPPALIEQAAAFVPGSEVAVIENTGHSPYFERAASWNDVVLRFLRQER